MTDSPLPPSPPDIMVVDDTEANLHLLCGMLKERGYKVRPVPNGRLALQAAKSAPPDLILLDIHMPEFDGYETCAQLKRDERTAGVPVIFISALNETIDKVLAFGVGGVDYVTKPFQFEEVDARVACHLKLRRLQLEVESRNCELQKSNAELRRLQELRDNLTHMIVHDLRSPLSGVLLSIDLLRTQAAGLSSDWTRGLNLTKSTLDQVMAMINSLLDVSKFEAGELTPNRTSCDLVALVHEVIPLLTAGRESQCVSVESDSPVALASVDRNLISRVFQNLLGNAFKFSRSTSTVNVRLHRDGAGVRVEVIDHGPGIPAQYHQRIFQKFGQVSVDHQRIGTGLGLTFCRLAVEAHGGKIGVTSEIGQGSTFWFYLPKVEA